MACRAEAHDARVVVPTAYRVLEVAWFSPSSLRFDAAAFARRYDPSEGWRNAVDLHHLPEGTHSLAPRPGSLVRLTFQSGLPSRSAEHEGWSAWQDLHLQPSRLERTPLLFWLPADWPAEPRLEERRLVLPVRFALTLSGV